MGLPSLAGGILIGGESRRMGMDKAMLDAGGETLLGRVIRTVSRAVDEVIVAARDPSGYVVSGARLVRDRKAPRCPLSGLHAVLSATEQDAAFICAVDMPWVNPELIRFLAGLLDEYDGVVPRTQRGIERLHAVYRRRCLPAIERALDEGRWAVSDFYPDCTLRTVPIREKDWAVRGHSPFENLNTAAEYRAFLRDLSGSDP